MGFVIRLLLLTPFGFVQSELLNMFLRIFTAIWSERVWGYATWDVGKGHGGVVRLMLCMETSRVQSQSG